MGRIPQIIIGIILFLFAAVLMLMSTLPGEPGYALPRILGAILAAILGFACLFTWGRPISTRIALGLLSLSMVFMAIYALTQKDSSIKSVVFALLICFMSGTYAATGYYPDQMPFSEVFGKKVKKNKKKKKRVTQVA